MTRFIRLTGKLFGETATATGDDPQIGQFGSALVGTYNGTTDVSVIQSLPAWSNGFIDCVTASNQYPPLPEMTGFGKVLSYQQNYLLQQGIPEWDSGTTYYINNFCSKNERIFTSLTDSNLNNDPVSDSVNWQEFPPNDRFDGQWTASFLSMVLDASVDTSTGNMTFDLSNYLPNDNYKYEVLIRGRVYSPASSGKWVHVSLYSDILTVHPIWVCRITSNNNERNSNIGGVIIPVGTERKIIQHNHTDTITYEGIITIECIGYRRLGTNS